MVAPDDDDRVVAGRAFLERIEDVADTIIRVTRRGQVGPHRALHQSGILTRPFEIGRRTEFRPAVGSDDIVKIVEANFRELDAFQGMTVEVFLWHIPR